MKNIVRSFIVFLIAMTAAVTVSHAQTGPPIVDVNIVGSEASIQLDTTIPLDAEVTNEVESYVTNTPDNPVPTRDVDRATRSPFVGGVTVVIPDASRIGSSDLYTVPDASLLVIEHVGATARVDDQDDHVLCHLRRSGLSRSIPVPLEDTGIDLFGPPGSGEVDGIYAASQPVRFYARPSNTVNIACERSYFGPDSITISTIITGYLVPFP